MGREHRVVQGEHVSRIAFANGFNDYRTVWQLPENASLRDRRNPNILAPDDLVFIPDREDRTLDAVATGKTARFVLRTSPLKLRLVLLDVTGAAIANAPCELNVEGNKRNLTSDGGGLVEARLDKAARTATLRVGDIEYSIAIGALDPIEDERGWQARLINLGYFQGPVGEADPQDLTSAIEEFQLDQGIAVDGQVGKVTLARLRAAHGS